MKAIPFVIAVILLFFSDMCFSQEPDTNLYRIQTIDGNTFTGKILAEDNETLVLNTEKLGEITIQKADIRSRDLVQTYMKKDGQLWLPNPQSTRHFWSPNGYGLDKGTGYYQNIWVLYNQVSYGITDNFSMGVGTVPLFLFAGTSTPVWILPKFSFPVVKDKLNIGTGGLFATVLGEATGVFGLLYETTTVGSRDRNVSLGFAWGFADDNWMSRPLINISTMMRLTAKTYFISDNYLFPHENAGGKYGYSMIMSLGGRTIFGGVGLDYSLWIPVGADMDTFVAIPFLGVTIQLGKKGANAKQ